MSTDSPDKPATGPVVQIIELPNRLRAKVGGQPGGRPGQIDPAAIARAHRQVEQMAGAHQEQTRIDLTELLGAFEMLRRSPARRDYQKKVYKITDGIMAVGRTFGYDLLTEIATAMNHFLMDLMEVEAPSEGQLTVISLHIDAMQLVLRQEIKGDGGEVGGALKTSLAQARAKFQVRK